MLRVGPACMYMCPMAQAVVAMNIATDEYVYVYEYSSANGTTDISPEVIITVLHGHPSWPRRCSN